MRNPSKSFWAMAAGLVLLLAISLFFPSPVRSRSGDDTGREEGERTLYHALGVFRVFAVDALWMRMRTHKEEGRDGLVLADARTILKLEPDCDRIRDFLHWHLAFNMARRAMDEGARSLWIEEGLAVQEEGLRRDPESVVLNRGLGMTFFMLSDREDIYRDVCLRRYGLLPVQMAYSRLEKAWLAGGDTRTLLFLLQSLENGAAFEIGRGRPVAAADFLERAAAHAESGLIGEWEGADVDDLISFYREKAKDLRK